MPDDFTGQRESPKGLKGQVSGIKANLNALQAYRQSA